MSNPAQQLQQIIEQVAALQVAVQALQARPQQLPKPRLPDPVKFDGKAYHFDTWLPAIKAKLRVDSRALGDNIAQFYYVYDRLESSVQSQVLPQLAAAEEAEVWDYNSILIQLSRALDNPNKTQEAEDKLHKIDQATDSVPAYIARFERLLFEAKGHNWEDPRKISAFRSGLNSTIKNRLAQQLVLPHSYPDFLRAVQKLSSRSAAYNSNSGPSSSAPQVRFHNSRDDAMDTTAGAMHFNSPDLSPMQFNSVDTVPRQSYRASGACLRCGSFNHWLASCPEPARPSTNTRSAGASGKKVTITALENYDASSDTDSLDTMDRWLGGYMSDSIQREDGLFYTKDWKKGTEIASLDHFTDLYGKPGMDLEARDEFFKKRGL